MFLIPATNLDLFLISPPMSPYILFHPDFPLLYFSLTGPYCTRRIARLKALRPRKFPLLLYPICSTVNRPRPSLVRVSSGLPCVFFAQKLKPTPWPLATHICPRRSLRAPKPSIFGPCVFSLVAMAHRFLGFHPSFLKVSYESLSPLQVFICSPVIISSSPNLLSNLRIFFSLISSLYFLPPTRFAFSPVSNERRKDLLICLLNLGPAGELATSLRRYTFCDRWPRIVHRISRCLGPPISPAAYISPTVFILLRRTAFSGQSTP
jgi:hypothetical protein